MTQVLVPRTLPAPRHGGMGRRFVLVVLSISIWAGSLAFIGTGISPGVGEPTETDWRSQAFLLVVGALLLALPLLVITLPAQKRVRRLLEAVLAVAAEHPRPELPPFETWAAPNRMFQRLRVTCFTCTSIPLLLLMGSAIAFGLFLEEPVAGVVFAVLGLIPLFFAVVTFTLPSRLRDGVRAGLAAGQVVALRVNSRVDQNLVLNAAYMSWFDGILPDGQHITLRTPRHFAYAADARGVIDSSDLVLVMGKGGHQGLVLAPSRPEDAVWLLGPVPLVRVPRSVQKAFAGDLVNR